MGRKRRKQPPPPETPKEYSVQATPYVIRDLGWKRIKVMAEAVYPGFTATDFRPLVFGPSGETTCLDALGNDTPLKVFYGQLHEFQGMTFHDPNKVVMIAPYLDKDRIKVLYFKWADETLYDSFCANDGQNRVWNNRE